ncbi:hypothetical protein [Jannaschia sp. CCS1]|uniref:hypothetical protein n=1 Tax=Jannaschia sp. (strain CCS1) TaxID=290400 RepID=UPI000053BE84|nr:hypothetical protein [Jannaschia sp. CCS1]ABD55702.1 hypothetical protein Jann_2785 [Jannaschia sp. CCS1]
MRFEDLLKVGVLAATMALPCGRLTAQTEALTLTSMTVTRHDILRNIDTEMASPCCAQHVYESGAEEDFIYLEVDFAVAWSDELERIQISSGDIALQFDSETDARRPWGRVDFFPDVERGGSSLSARRPRDFPEETAGAYLNLVFTAPTAATTATLIIGEGTDALRLPVDLAVPVTDMPAPSSFYDIKVVAISTTEELVTEDRVSRNTIAGRMTSDIGTITRVEIEMTPFVGTDTDNEPGENQVFNRNTAFVLVGPEGLPLINLGRAASGSIRNNFSSSISWDGEGAGPTTTYTMFYLGSGAAGEYQLYFYDTLVGDVTLSE